MYVHPLQHIVTMVTLYFCKSTHTLLLPMFGFNHSFFPFVLLGTKSYYHDLLPLYLLWWRQNLELLPLIIYTPKPYGVLSFLSNTNNMIFLVSFFIGNIYSYIVFTSNHNNLSRLIKLIDREYILINYD